MMISVEGISFRMPVQLCTRIWPHILCLHKGCLPASPPFPTVRAPIYNCLYIYIVLETSVARTSGPVEQSEKRGDWGYVKNAKLLPTIPIPYSKIVVRVGEGALDVFRLNRKDPKRIRALWKVGDMVSCQKHHRVIHRNITAIPLMF
jgi:hypothetical protein